MTHTNAEWRAWIPPPEGVPFGLVERFPPLPGLWDLAREPEMVRHWVAILRANGRYVREIVAAEGSREQRDGCERVIEILEELFRELEEGDAAREVRTVHEITQIREALLRGHGLYDPYQGIKARLAQDLLRPAHTACCAAWEMGTKDDEGALTGILASMLAGNLFDLGSRTTQEAFRRGELDIGAAATRFRAPAEALLARLGGDARALLRPAYRRLGERAEGRVLVFADNAGPDFLLGVIPAALYWASRWEVIVVVNSLPASSDVTLDEAGAHLAVLAAFPGSPLEPALCAGRVALVGSGTGSPGIDLRHVGEELDAAGAGARWILFVGQGRGVETNWTTRFRCPAFRAAVIKDEHVARAIRVAPGAPIFRCA